MFDMSLDLNQYQTRALTTAHYPRASEGCHPIALAYCIGKLNGEAGETSEAFWKYQRSEGDFVKPDKTTRRKILDEAGDALWYIAAIASECGVSLETVASWNLEKLAARSQHGTAGWDEARKHQVLDEQVP